MKNKMGKVILDMMHKNPENWKGPFYFKCKDYRIIVPKWIPAMGWTLNFASPYAYIFLACIIIIAIGSKYFLK